MRSGQTKPSTSEGDFSSGSEMGGGCVFLLATSHTPYDAPGVECSRIGGGAQGWSEEVLDHVTVT